MEVEFIEQTHQYLIEGVLVPSVSEILRFIFPDKYKDVPHRVLKEKALFGTHIHEAIEAYEKGKEPCLTDMERVTFSQYLRFKEEYQIKPIEMEMIIHYKDLYAGRLDMTAYVKGLKTLIDVKTTCKLDYESLAWQLGMYKLAYGKARGIPIEKCCCLWLPKKDLGQLVEIEPKNKDDILEVLGRYEKQKSKIVCYF